MPELPEVETVRRALRKHLPGRRIERLLVRDHRLRWPVDEKKLRRLIVGGKVISINRRAKYLLINLNQQNTLVMHLGMSGRILFYSEPMPFEKHDHVIFYFDNGTELRFRDTRRFGMVDAIPAGEIKTYPRFVHLGFEPLAKTTTAEKLFEQAKHRQRPIKSLIMDANFIVGVGNIYASEALFHAGIHPITPAGKLSLKLWQKLFGEIQSVLKLAIKKGGTTLNDFVSTDGEIGYFQLSLAVYGREGEKCQKCGFMIERVVQVGRSTFFCSNCQREK